MFYYRLAVCFLCFSGCVFAFSGNGWCTGSDPSIHAEDKIFDFGKAFQKESIPHVFYFKNAGGGILKVKKVRSSCGCTAALASKDELRPGETGELKITFKTGSMKGHKSKTVFLHTNDPVRPVTEFKIVGVVIPQQIGSTKDGHPFSSQSILLNSMYKMPVSDISVEKRRRPVQRPAGGNLIVSEPASLEFSDVPAGVPAQREALVKGKKPFQITGSRTTLPFITVAAGKISEGVYTVTTGISNRAPAGNFIGSVILFTDNPLQTSAIIRVSGNIVPEDEAGVAVSE